MKLKLNSEEMFALATVALCNQAAKYDQWLMWEDYPNLTEEQFRELGQFIGDVEKLLLDSVYESVETIQEVLEVVS